MVGKTKLVFDTTDVDSVSASDNVGAYVRSSDGTLITHTTEGLKEALDVYIAGGAAIEVELDHTEDSVRLGNGTDFLTSTTIGGDIGLDVNIINTSIEVTATDLDIRDLDYNTDSVTAHQGGTWTIDSITNTVDVSDAALANTAILATANALDVANTSEAAVAAALADRKYLWLLNNSNRTMYIGQSGVTAANGFPLSPQAAIEMRAGAAVAVHFVTNSAGSEVRALELS